METLELGHHASRRHVLARRPLGQLASDRLFVEPLSLQLDTTLLIGGLLAREVRPVDASERCPPDDAVQLVIADALGIELRIDPAEDAASRNCVDFAGSWAISQAVKRVEGGISSRSRLGGRATGGESQT